MYEFSIVLIAIGLAIWLTLALLVARIAARVRALEDRYALSSPSAIESLRTVQQEQADALAALANRVKMQRVRTAVNHVQEDRDGLPDPHKDPDAWRKAMNAKLALTRIQKGSA